MLADQQRRSDDEKKKLLGAEDVERPANHPDTAHGRQRAFRLGIDTAGTGRAIVAAAPCGHRARAL